MAEGYEQGLGWGRGGTRLHAGGLCSSHVAKYKPPGVRRLCRRPCHASVLRPRVNCASLPSPWGTPHDLARFRHFPRGSRLPREVLGDTCPLTVLRLPQAQLPTTSGPRIVEHIGDASDACGLGGGVARSFRPRSLDHQRVAGSSRLLAV